MSDTSNLPRAKTRHRKWRLSIIWLVPVIAALAAAYLIYQRVTEYGSTITILFRDVEGVKLTQTRVHYRGADIGEVTSIALTKDQKYATVQVKLRRYASDIAREGSTFWIVRPQLGMGNLTGLGTIITGPYIAVQPGKGKETREFTAVETSPAVLDPNGLKFVLLAENGASLRAGVPIYYRGIEVGAVRETRLSTNAATVEIHCVIRHRYAPLVRVDSKFWNVTGLDVHFGLFTGADVSVESLKSLLMGGIAFATPEKSSPDPVPADMVFRLFDKPEKDWDKWSPHIDIPAADDEKVPADTKPATEIPVPQANAR